MKTDSRISIIISYILGIVILAIGVLNVVFVHPVPGIILLLLSLPYFPFTDILRKQFHWTVPLALKIILFVLIAWFTLGISDLGDMID